MEVVVKEIFHRIAEQVRKEKTAKRLRSRAQIDTYIERLLREHGFKREINFINQQEAMCKIHQLLREPPEQQMTPMQVAIENEPYLVLASNGQRPKKDQ